MIIGEQRLSENNYYSEPSNQLDGLKKRKLSSENESRNMSSSYVGPEVIKNLSSNKMHFVENLAPTYSAYQNNEQIQQDGDQSYINLTVLTPPALIRYDKVQIDCCRQDEESQNFDQINISRFQENNEINCLKSKLQDSNISKYEVKNYHQNLQSGIFNNIKKKIK